MGRPSREGVGKVYDPVNLLRKWKRSCKSPPSFFLMSGHCSIALYQPLASWHATKTGQNESKLLKTKMESPKTRGFYTPEISPKRNRPKPKMKWSSSSPIIFQGRTAKFRGCRISIFFCIFLSGPFSGSSCSFSGLQGGPLPVISGVISPINGLING